MRYIYIIIGVILLAACNENPVDETPFVEMPVYIHIPAEGVSSRALPVDPGTTELFVRPTMAKIYLATYPTQADDEAKTNINIIPQTIYLDTNKWELNDNSTPEDISDDLWEYTGSISLWLPSEKPQVARAYIAVFNTAMLAPSETLTINDSNIETEEDIKAITFDVPSALTSNSALSSNPSRKEDLDAFLRNLYSTPVGKKYPNNMPAGYEAFEGKYYGTVLDMSSNQPHLDIVCYHVAAKLDLTWNIDDTLIKTKKITSITVNGLVNTGCSLFEPTKIYPAANKPSGSYNELLVETGVGNQWSGRASIYVIQNSKIGTSGEENGKKIQEFEFSIGVNTSETKTGTATAVYDESSIYTPWMRGAININE